MTRKHFIALADILYDLRQDMVRQGTWARHEDVFNQVYTEMVILCKNQNPRFDSYKFYDVVFTEVIPQ